MQAFIASIIAVCLLMGSYALGRTQARTVTVNICPELEQQNETDPPPAPSVTPPPAPSPKAPLIPDPDKWVVVDSSDWLQVLPGKWIGVDGDAVSPEGKLVVGGARAEFFHQRKGSLTPWNVRFTAPRRGDDSKRAAGGCGFDEEGDAWCKGYGIPDNERRKTVILIERNGELLRVRISGVTGPILLKRGEGDNG